MADPLPGDIERHAPVDPDDVAADRPALLQQVRVAGSEVNRRHVDRLEHPRRVGRDELAIIRDREVADPRVEQLDNVRPGPYAAGQVPPECVGELVH